VSSVYSRTFIALHDLSGSSIPFGPPPGFVWVIRGVDAVNGELLNNVLLKGPAGQVIWANSYSGTVAFAYASYRGRYVLEAAETATLETTAALDVSVWGYELSLP
jgi:hypothetical protein